MPRKSIAIVVAGLALAPAAIAKNKKQHVHDHGHAKLGAAVDGGVLALDLEIPGDDVFGFEHPPRTDAEKKLVADALATLNHQALELFVLPADRACTVEAAKAESHQEGEHGDVDASYKLKCAKPLAGAALKLGLFRKFPRLKEVRVQLNAGDKQATQAVTDADTAIAL